MKRFKTVLVFALGILATAIFGACSCTKDSTISVTSLTLSTQVANSTSDNNKLVLDVVVGDKFEITYNLAPKATTNTKVYVDIVTPGGSAYLTPEAYIFDNGTSYSVKFEATSINENADPTPVEVKFTSDSANHTANALVRIHDLPEPLATPQNLTYSGGKLTWDAVEHADKYIVAINGKDYTTPSTELTPVLNVSAENIINVTAISESIEYANGQASDNIKIYPLSTPTITSSNNGVLTWDAVENATKYILTVNNTDYQLSSDILTYDIKSLTSASQYDIKLKAVFEHRVDSTLVDGFSPYTDDDGCLYYIPSSEYSSVKTINRLSAPSNLKITNKDGSTQTDGILSWDRVQGATSYTVTGTNGTDFEFTTSDTYIDFENMTGFNYTQGSYSLTVKANGQASNTIADNSSVSDNFNFVKMGYLTGSVNSATNTLSIDVSSLYTKGLDSEVVGKIKYEIIFVYDDQTSIARNKNVTIMSDSATIQLSSAQIGSGTYRKTIIRPYIDDTAVINVANATKINIIDQISVFADGFVKLPNSYVTSITKESVLKVDVDAENIQSFEITLDDEDTQIIAKDADYIVIDETVNIDLTKLSFGFGQRSLASGVHKIKVRALSDEHVDADEASVEEFGFTKLSAVSDITVVSNQLSWSGVQNHSGYKVEFNTSSKVVFENTYSPSEVQNTNTAKITALGNDKNIINSDTITNSELLRADKVDTISITEGTVSWENQSGATNIIKFYYDGQFQNQQTTSSNVFDAFNLNRTSSFSITRRIDGKFDSLESDKIQVEQRKVVSVETIKIVNNEYKLKYENNESSPVLIKVVDANGKVNTKTYGLEDQDWTKDYSNPIITLDSSYFAVGLNYVTITKLGDSVESATKSQIYKVRSVESDRVEVEVLPSLTHEIENGVLSTSIVSKNNPKSMTISISSKSFTQKVNVEGKTAEFDLSTLDSGTYNVVASAQANANTNVINGADTMFEVSKIAGTTLKVVDGNVVFDKVSGATGYVVKMYNAQNEFVQNVTTNTAGEQGVVNVNSATLTAGITYKLSISVLANVEINSNESDVRPIQKLATVKNFTKQASTLSWDNVTNNNGYILEGQNSFVYSNTPDKDVVSLTIDNTSFVTAGKYTISILACGNSTAGDSDTGYLNGDSVSLDIYKLNAPANVRLVNGVLLWNTYSKIGQEHIEDTIVKITIDDDTYTYNCGKSTSLDLNEKTELADNGFTITIQFIGNGNDVIDSAVVSYDDNTVVSRLSAPVLNVVDGELCFEKVENAGSYKLYVLQSANNYSLISSQNYSLEDKETYYIVKFNNTALVTNNILNVVCQSIIKTQDSTVKIDSFYSDSIQIEKLQLSSDGLRIGNYNGIDGRLVWDKVDNATDYTIYINGKEFEQKIVVSGNATEYFDITSLSLVEGTYNITIRANGNATTSTTTNYLNSKLSNSVTISLKNDSIKIVIEDNTLKWDKVEGVDSYKVTISDGENTLNSFVQENGNNSYDLKSNAFLSTGGKTYTISVVPYKLKTSYYLVQSSAPIYLAVVKSYDVYDLGIEDGYITWKVNTSSIAGDSNFSTDFSKYFSIYHGSEELKDDEESLQKYEKYYPYLNFELVLNGISSNIVPMSYSWDPVNPNYIQCYYELTTPVTTNTRYSINVRSCGNNSVLDEDNNIVTSITTLVSSNLLTTELVAYKTTVPSGVVTSNGNITFNLVTTGDADHPYIQEYYIYAVPQGEGLYVLQTKIVVSDKYLATSPAPSTYTYNVKEWVSSQSNFKENIEYSYWIVTCGTASGNTSSTETLYLRSNRYSTVSMTFLSSINVAYSKDLRADGERVGAVVHWPILTTKQSMTHILYILPEDQAISLRNNWWKNESTMVITLDSKTNYFDFSSDEAKQLGINSDVMYRVAAKYGGDERNYITNDKVPSYINVMTLSTTTFDGSKVKNGVFEWIENSNASGYKVTLYKNVNGDITKSIHYTDTNKFALDSNTRSDAQYTISVVPFGNIVSGTNYVNGFANESTTPYYSLMGQVDGLQITAEDGNNVLTWSAVDGATNYTVLINETEKDTQFTRYILPEFSAGVYQIKVMAKATTNYLNGVYSDAVRLRKLYNPEVKVTDGIVSWSRGDNADDVLTSASTVLTIKACNESGNITSGGKQTILNLTQDDGLSYALDTEYDKGYYSITVKYNIALVGSGSVSEYQLSSDESNMLVYKLDAVSTFSQGKYVDPADITTTRDCNFDNYIKWKKVNNAFGYLVRLLDDDGNLIDTNTKTIKYQSGVMTGDVGYFQDCATDSDYICFNLAQMSSKRVGSANIEVTVLGNSTSDSLGYLNSNPNSFKVELPQGAPKITSTNNGVIRWIGAYDFTEEGDIINTYSETAVASNVEFEFTNVIQYTYDAETNIRTENSQTISANYTWEYEDGKEQVFYCPFASSSGIQVRVRYYNAKYVSEWSYIGTISENELFVTGTGTEDDPYIIAKLANETESTYRNRFVNIKYRPYSHFVIKHDVSMGGVTWQTIENFGGVVDGENHAISNLSLSNKSIFGTLLSGSQFKNINISNITLTSSSKESIAPIAITNNGTISNVVISGSANSILNKDSAEFKFGGMVVVNNGNILSSTSNYQSQISDKSTGVVGIYVSTRTYAYVGGFAVENYGKIDGCTLNSTITASSGNLSYKREVCVGGIAYSNKKADSEGIISNCNVLSTSVLSASGIGGIVYRNEVNSQITHCSMEASFILKTMVGSEGGNQIELSGYLGGLVGINKGYVKDSYVNLTNISYNIGSNESLYIGLLVGFSETYSSGEGATQTGSLTNCYISTSSSISLPNNANTNNFVGYVVGCVNSQNEVIENIYVEDKTISYDMVGSKNITITATKTDFATWKNLNKNTLARECFLCDFKKVTIYILRFIKYLV